MRNVRTTILGTMTFWALAAASPGAALAQSSVRSAILPLSFLRQVQPRTARSVELEGRAGSKKSPGGAAASTLLRTAAIPPAFDTIPFWSGQFTTPGFDSGGNPQSRWPYTMVGTAPESCRKTAIPAPIVPVTVDLLGPDGQVATIAGPPLTLTSDTSLAKTVTNSPVYQPFTYTSGTGQFNDQMMRAQFWDRLHQGADDAWHVTLTPETKCGRRMRIPFGSWFAFADDAGRPVAALVDVNAFVGLLFPPTSPVDDTTVVGAAELAGDITTHDISTFLFNNVFLYDGDLSNCCILGFHSYDSEPGDLKNGNRERRYVTNYASWITNGLFSGGFGDVTAISHEMSEIFNDPFGDNTTPWWLSSDPLSGAQLCQDNLESGDVLEVLSQAVFPASMHGRTYHPQNEALLPWFAFQSPSPANLGAYSFPDETVLTALSPSLLQPQCVPSGL